MKGYRWRKLSDTSVLQRLVNLDTGQLCGRVQMIIKDLSEELWSAYVGDSLIGEYATTVKAKRAVEREVQAPVTESARPPRIVEVCRSFSYKLNLQNHGGPQYESADFFSSRKMAVEEDYVQEQSEDLYQACVGEVRNTVQRFISDMRDQKRQAGERTMKARFGGDAAGFERWKAEQPKPPTESTIPDTSKENTTT